MTFDVPFVRFRVSVKSDLDVDLLTQMGTHQLRITE